MGAEGFVLRPKPCPQARLRLERLREMGHELRRPEADFLRDGIYELALAFEEFITGFHELRAAAALTQTRLARLIGTTASVICRLEDADYEGHSLVMLRRIAAALNQRVEIRFVPIRRSA